eukprot:Nitzschia sp. Nitz4//scaffold97_size77645//32073//33488//NITZ4_005517-RA/size77645-processed-gene-0.92-mRNA-1//-1//CDS//3329560653//658//frame0
MQGGQPDNEPDLELLARKIAKCDRLIKRNGKNHKDSPKLMIKRSEYIAQLGEVAYQAARSSVVMELESPTGVRDKLGSSRLQAFNDSFAALELSSPNLGFVAIRDKQEGVEEEADPNPAGQDSGIDASSEIPKEEIIEVEVQQPNKVPEDSAAFVEEPAAENADGVDASDENRGLEDKSQPLSIGQLLASIPDANEVPFDEDVAVHGTPKSTPVADVQPIEETSENDGDVDQGTSNEGEGECVEASEDIPVDEKSLPEGTSLDDTEADKTWEEVRPEEVEPKNANIEPNFDGEGSVSKLRAMFDSPVSKAKRSWKPRKSVAEISPVNLQLDDESDAKASAKPPVSHPMVDASELAGMTASAHDIDCDVVALVSLYPESLFDHLPKQNRAMNIFKGKGINLVYVDGSNPDEKLRRNELFEISGRRGVYPQLFVRNRTIGKLQYFADFDRIELLNDCDSLQAQIDVACQGTGA